MAYPETGFADTIARLRADRDALIEHFRVHGTLDLEQARAIERDLETVIQGSDGELQARARYELGQIQRLTGRFEEAIPIYERAALAAERAGLADVAFDAWLGIARSHAYGTRDHGAAASAFGRAVANAGTEPTPKQRYLIADYESQLQAGRGELEAALVNGLEAIRLARDDSERFYAQLDTADVLQKFAESCDYRKLVDAKTHLDGADSWGACRRAVSAARAYYEDAKGTAQRLGWAFLVKESDGFLSRLGARAFLIEQKASFEKLGQTGVFTATDVRDVLVNEDFASGASAFSQNMPLAELIGQVVTDTQTTDPRSIYLLGIKADLDGDPKGALAHFQRAADLLHEERSSLFDPRRRGTVVENRPELVRDLALRFLAFGRLNEAFLAFESIRSRGLSELAATYQQSEMTDAERKWLADLVQIDSQTSARLSLLVETAIAGIEHSKSIELLEELDRLEQRHRGLLHDPGFQETARRLASLESSPPSLAELQGAVRRADVPVLMFWVTHTNVLVWVVAPQGMEVKTVFLPEVAVIDKVASLTESIRSPNQPFDEKAARELHTYLIKPFSRHLTAGRVLMIPQGPLVNLPFEALLDAETGSFLAETVAVSYAPSATFAAKTLSGQSPEVSTLTAVYDQDIETITGEIAKIRAQDLLRVTARKSQELTPREAMGLLDHRKNIHVLLHGEFSSEDPLLSQVTLNNPRLSRHQNEITAAELLAVNWRDTRLAVFSSCEGARVGSRISNEVFGISWALLAGGVDYVLLSRWRVQSSSNADWMESFYSALVSERASPASAAAVAMRKMIGGGRRHPYFWAGPQVFGR